MSFSFSASGNPKDVIREVGQQAALLDQVPNQFADAINDQLGRLPEGSEVSLSCYGHTGWGSAQTSGEISMHVTMTVTRPIPSLPDRRETPSQ